MSFLAQSPQKAREEESRGKGAQATPTWQHDSYPIQDYGFETFGYNLQDKLLLIAQGWQSRMTYWGLPVSMLQDEHEGGKARAATTQSPIP